MVKWHRLKVYPQEFNELLNGMKHFEFRINDRDFQLFDFLVLEEWNPETICYTGRCLTRSITSMLCNKFSLPENLVILSIEKV